MLTRLLSWASSGTLVVIVLVVQPSQLEKKGGESFSTEFSDDFMHYGWFWFLCLIGCTKRSSGLTSRSSVHKEHTGLILTLCVDVDGPWMCYEQGADSRYLHTFTHPHSQSGIRLAVKDCSWRCYILTCACVAECCAPC